MKRDWWVGAGEILLGVVLISPADESILAAILGGGSAPIAPIQFAGSGMVGAALVYDGLRRI